jgi:hypothetical protein
MSGFRVLLRSLKTRQFQYQAVWSQTLLAECRPKVFDAALHDGYLEIEKSNNIGLL